MIDLSLRTDIDADRRLLEDQKPDPRLHPARDHGLLLVAAGKCRHRLLGILRLDRKPLECRTGARKLATPADELGYAFAGFCRIEIDVLAHCLVGGYDLLCAPSHAEDDI